MNYASKSQAENGTDNTTVMTPLRVKQAIQANSSNVVYDDTVYYSSGDAITLGARGADNRYVANGYVTSGTTVLHFPIVLPKRMDKITRITCTSLVGEMRCISGYINSTAGNIQYVTADYIVTCTKASDTVLELKIGKNDGTYTNITNNTPASFSGEIKLEFS